MVSVIKYFSEFGFIGELSKVCSLTECNNFDVRTFDLKLYKKREFLTKETSIMFSNVYGILRCTTRCYVQFNLPLLLQMFLMFRLFSYAPNWTKPNYIDIDPDWYALPATNDVWKNKNMDDKAVTGEQKTVSAYVITRKTTTLGHTWWRCAFELFSSWYCLMALVLYVVPFFALLLACVFVCMLLQCGYGRVGLWWFRISLLLGRAWRTWIRAAERHQYHGIRT